MFNVLINVAKLFLKDVYCPNTCPPQLQEATIFCFTISSPNAQLNISLLQTKPISYPWWISIVMSIVGMENKIFLVS